MPVFYQTDKNVDAEPVYQREYVNSWSFMEFPLYHLVLYQKPSVYGISQHSSIEHIWTTCDFPLEVRFNANFLRLNIEIILLHIFYLLSEKAHLKSSESLTSITTKYTHLHCFSDTSDSVHDAVCDFCFASISMAARSFENWNPAISRSVLSGLSSQLPGNGTFLCFSACCFCQFFNFCCSARVPVPAQPQTWKYGEFEKKYSGLPQYRELHRNPCQSSNLAWNSDHKLMTAASDYSISSSLLHFFLYSEGFRRNRRTDRRTDSPNASIPDQLLSQQHGNPWDGTLWLWVHGSRKQGSRSDLCWFRAGEKCTEGSSSQHSGHLSSESKCRAGNTEETTFAEESGCPRSNPWWSGIRIEEFEWKL